MDLSFWLPLILIVLIFAIAGMIIIVHFVKEAKKTPENEQNVFDERQKIERYKAGYTSFIIALIYIFIATLVIAFADFSKSIILVIMLVGIIFSLMIFLCICIWKDAFTGTKQPTNPVLAVYIIWTATFIINGIIKLLNVKEYESNFFIGISNLMFGIMFFIILINILVKKVMDKKAARKQESV